jgi:hypothetical protein
MDIFTSQFPNAFMPKPASDWKFATIGTAKSKKAFRKKSVFVSSRDVLYFFREESHKRSIYI